MRLALALPFAVAVAALAPGCRDRGAPGTLATEAGAASAAATVPPFRGRIDLGRWIRATPGEVGCWVERNLEHRDPRWSCSAVARPFTDDPCDDGFRAGPDLPEIVARRVHPLLRRITLAWEHGALQSALFAFDPDVPPGSMPLILGLDAATADAVAWHGPGRCDTPCYQVVVFEPEQVDCEEGPDDQDE